MGLLPIAILVQLLFVICPVNIGKAAHLESLVSDG